MTLELGLLHSRSNCGVRTVHMLLPLMQLPPGQSAVVGQLMGRPDDVHRLEELGLRSGVCVEMIQSGSPCIIRLGGCKLCFRETEACSVLVEVGADS